MTDTSTPTKHEIVAYCGENQYEIYGDYRDQVSNEMAEDLLNGNLEAFCEKMWAWEGRNIEYVEWADWEEELAKHFDFESWDDIPEDLREVAEECRIVDQSDYIDTCLRNWNGKVVGRLRKRNGDRIEFPNWQSSKDNNKHLQAYLKTCGIDGWGAEATYPDTFLVVLGRVDLKEVYQKLCKGLVPHQVLVSKGDFVIGHDWFRGSGTCGDVEWNAKPRKYAAEFQADEGDRYGVDAVFGLTGECWENELVLTYKEKETTCL